MEHYFHNDGPVDPLVIVDQTVPQTGDHIPRDIGMAILEIGADLIHLLADVVQRRRNSPLRKFILQQQLRRDPAFCDLP